MNDELSQIISNVSDQEYNSFIKNVRHNFDGKKQVDKVSIDDSWVHKVHEYIPYIDNIVRNPRRFIVQEEDIVPIEKTKKVTEESIKHLAQNTGLIQDIDDDGMVMPLKLLNVYKEETIDLYENRFVYSLINNLAHFVKTQLTYEGEDEYSKEFKNVKYSSKLKLKNEDINYSMNININNYEPKFKNRGIEKEYKEKLLKIREVISDFESSLFMKEMRNATPVRSPIRKTNAILKDQDLVKALELWEIIEKYQIEPPLSRYKDTISLNTKNNVDKFDYLFFLNYNLLKGIESETPKSSKEDMIKKVVYDLFKDFSVDDQDLRKILNDEMNKAKLYKEEELRRVQNIYENFISKHEDKRIAALNLLK